MNLFGQQFYFGKSDAQSSDISHYFISYTQPIHILIFNTSPNSQIALEETPYRWQHVPRIWGEAAKSPEKIYLLQHDLLVFSFFV